MSSFSNSCNIHEPYSLHLNTSLKQSYQTSIKTDLMRIILFRTYEHLKLHIILYVFHVLIIFCSVLLSCWRSAPDVGVIFSIEWPLVSNSFLNPFAPNAPLLYPSKTSKNLTVKGCIGNKWVNWFTLVFMLVLSYKSITNLSRSPAVSLLTVVNIELRLEESYSNIVKWTPPLPGYLFSNRFERWNRITTRKVVE